MKTLNDPSTAIFKRIIALAGESGCTKINNAEGAFMPLCVELIGNAVGFMGVTMSIYSLAHYYDLFGDPMADPEMTFFVFAEDDLFIVYPASYRQDGLAIDQESIFQKEDKWFVAPRLQMEHATFANQWLRNIQRQQKI